MSWLSQTFHNLTGRNLSDVTGIGGSNQSTVPATPTGPGDSPPQGGGLIPKAPPGNPPSNTTTVVVVGAVVVIAVLLIMRK